MAKSKVWSYLEPTEEEKAKEAVPVKPKIWDYFSPENVKQRLENQRDYYTPKPQLPPAPKPNPNDSVPLEENLKFADASFPMRRVSDAIEINEIRNCRGWILYQPGFFTVVEQRYWNYLEDKMTWIQDFYNRPLNRDKTLVKPVTKPKPVSEDDRFFLDNKNHKGLFVAAWHRNEWHRGWILKCFLENKEHFCRVVMLDYGDHKELEKKFVRRIPERFLKEFPALGIKCSLLFEGNAKPLNAPDFLWSKKEGDVFREVMECCKFQVEFVRYYMNPVLPNELIWRVRVRLNTVDRTEHVIKVGEDQVADMFLEKLQKEYERQEGGRIEEDVKEQSLEPYQSLGDMAKILEVSAVSLGKDLEGINEPLDEVEGLFVLEGEDGEESEDDDDEETEVEDEDDAAEEKEDDDDDTVVEDEDD